MRMSIFGAVQVGLTTGKGSMVSEIRGGQVRYEEIMFMVRHLLAVIWEVRKKMLVFL